MTERERLIELLNDVASTQYEGDKIIKSELDIDDEDINHIADYLLANGVIVPPCKVGDTVYQVTRNFISEFRVRFIEISTCGNLFLHTDLINGIVYTGEIFSKSEIGKTVFLTKEETEKALHKINHNSLCENETYKVDK